MAVNDNSVPTTNKHSLYAAYVFGSIIFIFFIWVFFFPPAVLLDEQRKILAIFSALLCAFFTVFFVGTLNIEGDWLGFSIKGGGGLAVFVIVLWWWFDSSTPPIPPIPPSTQETIINARNGDKIAQYEGYQLT